MQISFKISEEDIVAFSEYHHKKSLMLRKANRLAIIAYFVTFVIGSVALWLATGDRLFAIAFLALGMIGGFLVPKGLRGSRRKLLHGIYCEGKNLALFAPQSLWIEPDHLVHESVSGVSQTAWGYIESVDLIEGFTFVYLTAVTAFVIPMHGVATGDYDSFVHELQKRWRDAIAISSAADHDGMQPA